MSKHIRALRITVVLGAVWVIGWAQLADAAAQWTERGYVVFQQNTLEKNLPSDHVPSREAIVSKVSCALAQGEYKSVKIGVHALNEDLQSVRLELESDLDARIYRPIDTQTKELLLGYENPVPASLHGECLDETNEIASLEKEKTSFFWVTLHAKKDATPGQHRGTIRIQPSGRPATELDLEVTVRPYELQRARIAYGPFFYGEWGRQISLPTFAQTEEWLGAFFHDMAEHSHTSVTGLGMGIPGSSVDFSKLPPPENKTFATLLPLAKQAGLVSADIPVIQMAHNLEPGNHVGITMAQQNEGMDWYEAEREEHGWPELVSYGRDEPGYPSRYPNHRADFQSFRDIRMRVACAMSAYGAFGLGEVHDIWIMWGGQITPEMADEAERLGAEVWTYACEPLFSGPLRERYYAGLYVWAYKLKGHTTWHHYAQTVYKMVWMREGDKRPMPLVRWETRREGIDDYRYLQMLEDCVAAKPDDPVATEAKQWMANLRARITVDPHKTAAENPLALDEYDQIREKAADYIERIGPVPADQIPPITRGHLKDEAAPFRGKSVEECVAGLSDEKSTVRRSATWALFEMGPKAAPAVTFLTNLLDDAEVRMPALRALEAIGPESLPALPKLTALLKHPDGFVRLGTVYALSAIGAPAVDALEQAVQQSGYDTAGEIAGRGLAALGSEALPALPTLIKLLDGPGSSKQHPALEAIKSIGPEAASAVPHIMRNWNAGWNHYPHWIGPLAAIGPAAAEAVPMLEQFRKEFGHTDPSDPAYPTDSWVLSAGTDALTLHALYRIRRSPEDLRELVSFIGDEERRLGGKLMPNAEIGLKKLEELGSEAAEAAPWIRELIDKGGLNDDVKKRLEVFLTSIAAE